MNILIPSQLRLRSVKTKQNTEREIHVKIYLCFCAHKSTGISILLDNHEILFHKLFSEVIFCEIKSHAKNYTDVIRDRLTKLICRLESILGRVTSLLIKLVFQPTLALRNALLNENKKMLW